MMNIRFELASEDDIPELTKVMKRAFDDDSQRHLGKPEGGPPGYDNGEFFKKWMLSYKESHGYKILKDGELVGFVMAWINENQENQISNIFIDPQYQRNGIGSEALQFLEKMFPDTKNWSLSTPKFAKSNHSFYTGNGYEAIDEMDYDGLVQIVFKKIIEKS